MSIVNKLLEKKHHSNNKKLSNKNTLPTLLLSRFQSCTDAIALQDNDKQYTYDELIINAADIAVVLHRYITNHNETIGLFMDASANFALGMWGILFSGAAYFPLNTDEPAERLTYMIDDAQVKLILTNTSGQTYLKDLLLKGVTICNIDEVPIATSEETEQLLANIYAKNTKDVAYVIYTSGSTGKPKGVAISHGAIVNQMSWIIAENYLAPNHRILQKTPVCFDAAQWELLGSCCGACVVIAEPGSYRDPESLIYQIKQYEITTLQCVPTLWQELIGIDDFASCQSLQNLFSGGESLSNKLARNITRIMHKAKLVNLYGPTECTINCTHLVIDHEQITKNWKVAPIGRPVAGVNCHVLNDQLQPVKPGDSGELFISGNQLAEGYLFNPEKTNEKFLTLATTTSSMPIRIYRTGDLVRQDSYGILHFLGRIDNQVKFRGYRIELDEIRQVMENHVWVKSAAVFIAENKHSGYAQLVGAVELNANEALLMDQGIADSHHQTKSSRVQIKAQLSNNGFRTDDSLSSFTCTILENKQENVEQRKLIFARKTYRFYHGDQIELNELVALLTGTAPPDGTSASLSELNANKLGVLLRYLGPFNSEERLLAKFGYASPGALYATQLYIELVGIAGIPDGIHYFHPAHHHLYHLADSNNGSPLVRLHFIGNIPAIREVYKNNILEVLEMECGHLLGLLDYILPQYGYGIGAGQYTSEIMKKIPCPSEHSYLGSYDVGRIQL